MKQRRTARVGATDVSLAYRQLIEVIFKVRAGTCVTREKIHRHYVWGHVCSLTVLQLLAYGSSMLLVMLRNDGVAQPADVSRAYRRLIEVTCRCLLVLHCSSFLVIAGGGGTRKRIRKQTKTHKTQK